MAIANYEVDGVVSFLEFVLKRVAMWRGTASLSPNTDPEKDIEVWFRGQSRMTHRLLPSAYRGDRDHTTMFNRFVAAGAGAISPPPATEWDWYFVAQHYELPTRLLDWTEDPVTALYFAVRGMLPDDAVLDLDPADPPVVWMMDAGSLNCLAYGIDEVLVPYDQGVFTRHWLPSAMTSSATAFIYEGKVYTNERPIAAWPTRTTPRIMAQNGCFTIHGTATDPVESLFDTAFGEHAEKLLRICILNAERVDRELSDLAVSRLRLFPELQNVASRLRRLYKSK